VERKGTSKTNVDPKVLREGRDQKMLLLKKQKPSRKKEEMCTWILQAYMHIMRHGWLIIQNGSRKA
jgi:hypothetical protein